MSFGAAPALILYLWSSHEVGGIGWIAALFYAVCCALRLARFNTMLSDPNTPAWARYYFTGVPAPAGAFLVVLPLMLSFEVASDGGGGFASPWLTIVALVGVGTLMVSRVPTFSMKQMRIPRALTLPALILAALFVAALVTLPWATLLAIGALYLASIPLSVIVQRRATTSGPSDMAS